MRIRERVVCLKLTDRGYRVLEMAGLQREEAEGLRIKEDDRAGLWARVRIEGAESLLLIRWQHVLSVEFRELKLRLRGPAR